MTQKISSREDLARLKEKYQAETEMRGGPKELQITVHMGTCGIAAGARDILDQLTQLLLQMGIHNVTLRRSGCIGLCDQEPLFTLTDGSGREFLYGKLNEAKVRQIVRDHVLKGEAVIPFIVDV